MANFYEFKQNNSGGSFVVDDKLCSRLVIEAKDSYTATKIAEDLGCYWDGCEEGIDCPCCGDRWYPSADLIDLDRWKEEGYPVGVYEFYPEAEKRWFDFYGKYKIVKKPEWVKRFSASEFTGNVYFENIEEYCQFMSDSYGWTIPDCRIFYKDGRVVEIFSKKDLKSEY